MFKIILACITTIITVIVVAFVIILFAAFPQPSKSNLEKTLVENETEFNNLICFFKDCGYKELNVNIHSVDGHVKAFSIDKISSKTNNLEGDITLDEYVIEQFEYLLRDLKFRSATKENNYIAFQYGADMDTGWGILYLLEGDEPKKLKENDPIIFKELKTLPLDNWYYYVQQYKITR